MSGIFAIAQDDGRPLADATLEAATAAMAFRGPDARRTWRDGSIGLGHTLLSTGGTDDPQPRVVDDVAIVADARLDDRDTLRARLRDAGTASDGDDAQLIASAYRAWGTGAPERLLGDFAFVLWDAPRRRLVAACDHLGLGQIYYTRKGGTLAVANTIAAARIAVNVPDELDEVSVGDFLLFGVNLRHDATIFGGLRRLPGGHVLEWADGSLTVRRYWALRQDHDLVRFARPADYVDRFRDVLGTAVADRMRGMRVALSMSGGLDSTTMAAAMAPIVAAAAAPPPTAFTLVYDRVIHHDERRYAGLAADALGFPIEFVPGDDAIVPPPSSFEQVRWAEPTFRAFFSADVHLMASIARCHRVLFSGEGADAVMASSPAYYRYRLGRGEWVQLGLEILATVVRHRLAPPTSLSGWLRRKQAGVGPMPAWLAPDFVARTNLADRWRDAHVRPPSPHPHRPAAYRQLTGASMARYLEHSDAGMTGLPLRIVHPYLDLRVVDYLLSIPQLPWTVRKYLLRTATAGVLPDSVRFRPKTTLAEDPVMGALRGGSAHGIERLPHAAGFERFVRAQALNPLASEPTSASLFRTLRALALNAWCLTRQHTYDPGSALNRQEPP